MSSHEHLSAASNDRKARLAQLKSLKRKQAPSDDTQDSSTPHEDSTALTTTEEEPSVVSTYLSGRNFDPSTRNVKLGFENTPIADQTSTLEYKAQQLALATKLEQAQEKESEPLDLFKLQPKKPNWDLKRDLETKISEGGLQVATENAVARLVRERVEAQRLAREQKAIGGSAGSVAGAKENGGDGQEVGMEGGELVEAMHQREVEEERERRREEQEEVVEG
jgi:coiled-coil domain-containing protein 12